MTVRVLSLLLLYFIVWYKKMIQDNFIFHFIEKL